MAMSCFSSNISLHGLVPPSAALIGGTGSLDAYRGNKIIECKEENCKSIMYNGRRRQRPNLRIDLALGLGP